MSTTALIIIGCVAAGIVVLGLVVLGLPGGSGGGASLDQRAQMRTMVTTQRRSENGRSAVVSGQPSVFDSVSDASSKRVTDSRLTLQKRLKYAQWRLPAMAFRGCEIGISLVVFLICRQNFNLVLQFLSLLAGPIFMRWLLNTMMDMRFKKFDADYPAFLLSSVGLLKTGMNPIGALEAAAEGLEPGSLVKEEVDLMLERLRFGVSEDKSIGSFGEDIYHPEIELFVQALLLSRRVGGTLSDTLERLAKQVRKRQYFRSSANAAVGMQRGSIWFIVAILCAMEIYLWFIFPEAITVAINDEMGWQVYQFSFIMILLGMFWVRQVTKIRV